MCAAQRVTGEFDKLSLKNKGPCDVLHLARAHSLLLFVEPRVGSMSRAAGLIYYVVSVVDVPAPSVNLTENCERSYVYGYIFFFSRGFWNVWLIFGVWLDVLMVGKQSNG